MDRAETVTLFYDMLLAPGTLLGPDITWEQVDGSSARARFTPRGGPIGFKVASGLNSLRGHGRRQRRRPRVRGQELVQGEWRLQSSHPRGGGQSDDGASLANGTSLASRARIAKTQSAQTTNEQQ